MAHGKDYVPRRDSDYDQFFRRITNEVGVKTSGQNPPWNHIPPAAEEALDASYAEWYAAYAPTLDNPTSVQIREKNRVRKVTEKALRRFIQRYLKDDPVTAEERDALGVTNDDTSKTPIGEPPEHVLLIIKPAQSGEHLVNWEVLETGSKAVPYGYDGVVLVRRVLENDEPVPVNASALADSRLLTKNNVIVGFRPEDRGKRCVYCACWQNKKGDMGRWCDIVLTYIP
jgi:hypothetical protein